MKYFSLSALLFFGGIALTACGSSSGGGGGAVVEQDAQSFYVSDGQCYRAKDNSERSENSCKDLLFFLEDGECFRVSDERKVAINNCTSNQYFLGNNECYDRNGDRVASTNCISDSTSDSDQDIGDFFSEVCDGTYYQPGDTLTTRTCNRNTRDCSGLTLLTTDTFDFIKCL